jgi:hypothetical protein
MNGNDVVEYAEKYGIHDLKQAERELSEFLVESQEMER